MDMLAPHLFDDRFRVFKEVNGNTWAINDESRTVGTALCEAQTWISNSKMNDRFKAIPQSHFGSNGGEYLFPSDSQTPVADRPRAKNLSILWQIRHNISHNVW